MVGHIPIHIGDCNLQQSKAFVIEQRQFEWSIPTQQGAFRNVCIDISNNFINGSYADISRAFKNIKNNCNDIKIYNIIILDYIKKKYWIIF